MLESEPAPKKHLVSIFDSPEEGKEHDIQVKNLISAKGKQAVLPEIEGLSLSSGEGVESESWNSIRLHAILQNKCGNNSKLPMYKAVDLPETQPEWKIKPPIFPNSSILVNGKDSYERCRATVLPSYINSSLSWGYQKNKDVIQYSHIYHAYESLSPPSIIVSAAGNFASTHPQIFSLKAKASKKFNVIVVGNLEPDNHSSKFSQYGHELTIMAPAGNLLTSATDNGGYKKFSGTSGATPLVTASLAGFEWMSGYHPTAKEAKILLSNTKIPNGDFGSDNTISPQHYHSGRVGMVNAYKLGIMGKRFKKKCGRNIACFREAIQNPDNYQWPIEDQTLASDIQNIFPHCSCQNRTRFLSEENDKGYKTNQICSNKKNVFKRLRKAYLLQPQNKEYLKNIACIYSKAGLEKDAEALLNSYRAIVGRYGKKNNKKYCNSDSDCTLVPKCKKESNSSTTQFIPMNTTATEIHYIKCIQKGIELSCNGRCRCDRIEKSIVKKSHHQEVTTYESKCKHLQCVISSVSKLSSIKSSNNNPIPPTNNEDGSNAIQ